MTARAFAVASVAMYDAYNSVHRIGDPYLILIPGADDVSSEAFPGGAVKRYGI